MSITAVIRLLGPREQPGLSCRQHLDVNPTAYWDSIWQQRLFPCPASNRAMPETSENLIAPSDSFCKQHPAKHCLLRWYLRQRNVKKNVLFFRFVWSLDLTQQPLITELSTCPISALTRAHLLAQIAYTRCFPKIVSRLIFLYGGFPNTASINHPPTQHCNCVWVDFVCGG